MPRVAEYVSEDRRGSNRNVAKFVRHIFLCEDLNIREWVRLSLSLLPSFMWHFIHLNKISHFAQRGPVEVPRYRLRTDFIE